MTSEGTVGNGVSGRVRLRRQGYGRTTSEGTGGRRQRVLEVMTSDGTGAYGIKGYGSSWRQRARELMASDGTRGYGIRGYRRVTLVLVMTSAVKTSCSHVSSGHVSNVHDSGDDLSGGDGVSGDDIRSRDR